MLTPPIFTSGSVSSHNTGNPDTARDQALFPLHTAVHKMTGLPAARFALGARGRIHAGGCADLVLFDPARVRDTASFHDPVRAAEGIDAVWVNGKLAYDGNEVIARPGQFIAPT